MKAFFLDRDGVINKSHSINQSEDFELIEGAEEAVRILNELGYMVFVVTNQAGVSLGYITSETLDEIHDRMIELIEAGGGAIREVRACTHKPSHNCRCRKPKPGMMEELIKKYGVERTWSFMVGDRDVDIIAGEKAGLRTILIGDEVPHHIKPDYRFGSLLEAVQELQRSGMIG
jgi:D-glycero-D-manno-heptose 1,7-bisphosphate phosphatase